LIPLSHSKKDFGASSRFILVEGGSPLERFLGLPHPMSLGTEMHELLVQLNILGIELLCFMPASESAQSDSMQNVVSRSFLLSLWWKELTCLVVLVGLALLVTARIALRKNASQRAADDPLPTDAPEGLNEVMERR
jgi:hypothetical protein